MKTHIREEPEMAFLGVGQELRVDPNTISDSGYLTVRQPQPGESIHILQTWSCPSCKKWPQWAEIAITNDVIASIVSVPFNRETLDRIHFIDDEAKDVAAALVNKSYTDVEDDEVVPILRKALP